MWYLHISLILPDKPTIDKPDTVALPDVLCKYALAFPFHRVQSSSRKITFVL